MLAIVSDDEVSLAEKYGENAVGEKGDSTILCIYVPGRTRQLIWDITGMTGAELDATRKFFEHLFDLADPIVRERDRLADEAFSKGDDTYARVYREVPTLVIRPRQERSDGQGVLNGSENVAGQHGSGGDQ